MSALNLFTRICDDAAVFPPGNMPLPDAVSTHLWRQQSSHAAPLGPLVVPAADMPRLATIVSEGADTMPDHHPANLEDLLGLAVTVPTPLAAGEAAAAARAVPFARLAALEIAVPDAMPADLVVPALRDAIGEPVGIAIYIEIPRDHRRGPLISALSGTRYLAKLRTGGVRAELFPDETELAATLIALVKASVPFKATAGLHHAVRNTDPEAGFEQHGFLNLLTAVDAAIEGAGIDALVSLLADRDGENIAGVVHRLPTSVRGTFRSFGTCSIGEPIDELVALGLLPPEYHTGQMEIRA